MRDLPTTEYELLDLLDRLEELIEDMDDLGIVSRDDCERLMGQVRQRLDDLEPDNDNG